MALLLSGPALADASAPPSPASIVEALLDGRDTTAIAARAGALAAAPTYLKQHRSISGSQLTASLDALEAALRFARQHSDAVPTPALLDAMQTARAMLLLADAELDATKQAQASLPSSAVIRARLNHAATRLRRNAAELETALQAVVAADSRGQRVTAIDAALAVLKGNGAPPPMLILGANPLPNHRPQLPPRAPLMQPTILPSYASGTAVVEPLPEDLAASDDAPLSPAVREQAAALAHNYLRIADFMRTQITTEWYAGSMKGVDETLRTRAGNDVDQAALLIALLRASSAPARYVHGVVEVPAEDMAAMIGVARSDAGNALTRAGVANQPVISGGQVSAYRIEHSFVSAYVPFTNYRGSVADRGGEVWLPLMPALKPHTARVPDGSVPQLIDLDFPAWLEEELQTPRSTLPWPRLRDAITAALAALDPPAALEDLALDFGLDAQALQALPASTPFPVVAVTAEHAVLAPEYQQRLRLRLSRSLAPGSESVMDAELPLSRLSGRRVSLGYLPATVEDQHLANRLGGQGAVPLHLLRLRPALWVDGVPISAGAGDLPAGTAHRLQIDIDSPAGTVEVSQIMLSGGLASIAIDAQGDRPLPAEGDLSPAADIPAARVLHPVGARYQYDWNEADAALAAALQVRVLRPFPNLALVLPQYRVEEAFGLPQAMIFDGVALDALLRPAEPFARRDAVDAAHWQRLSALHGSALEKSVFEQLWAVDSVSADSGLRLASSTGIPRLQLAPGSSTDAIGLHASEVRDAVSGWLSRGYHVDIPRDPLLVNAWRGSTWRVHQPATGETGYFIAGNYAGGVTVVPPLQWYFQDLAALLANPYGAAPNTDPLAAALLQLDPDAQGQRGTVGKLLPRELIGYVTDSSGRAVAGAQVSFRITFGEGELQAGESQGLEVTALTDDFGIARAALLLPQEQGTGSYFLEAGNPHPDWGSLTRVALSVRTADGDLETNQQYNAYAFPDEPANISISAPFTTEGALHLPETATPLSIRVTDQYGNPVANASIAMEVGDTWTPEESCAGTHTGVRDSGLYEFADCPSDGALPGGQDCAQPNLQIHSRREGGTLGLVLSNRPETDVVVRASVAGVTEDQFALRTYGRVWAQSDGSCMARVDRNLITQWAWFADAGLSVLGAQSIIDAMPVAQPMAMPRQFAIHRQSAPADGQSWVEWQPQDDPAVNVELVVEDASVLAIRPTQPGHHEYDLLGHHEPMMVSGDLVLVGSTGLPVPLYPAWTVALAAPTLDTDLIELDSSQFSLEPFSVTANLAPVDYRVAGISHDLLADGEVVRQCYFDTGGHGYACRFVEGLHFEPGVAYTVRTAANHGTPFYMTSEQVELPFTRGLISGYGTPPATLPLSEVAQQIAGRLPERIETSREIDVYTGYSCGQGARFAFTLGAPASVSLAFHAFDASGDVVTFPTREPLRDQAFEAGTHEIFLGSTDLPFGSYEFRLTAEDGAGNADEHRGIARSRLNRRDSLPLSHPFVKGVDLYGGQAVISAVDVEFPGRGPGLRFTRTYNSHAGDQPTAMGQGWHSDLDSQVVSDSCGTLTVTGAAGQGQRFIPAGTDSDGTLRFTPIGGYHGNLRYRLGGYDFIARDGTRYRFEGALNRLAFVEDPNGNRVTTERDLLGRATRVFDSAGRELRLSYQFLTRSQTEAGCLISESRELLTGIEASGGIRVEYEYDNAFNLVEVRRSDADAVISSPSAEEIDRYSYTDFGGVALTNPNSDTHWHQLGHRLDAATNAVNDATRGYTYTQQWVAHVGESGAIDYLPELRVETLVEPDGGETGFEYIGIRGLGEVEARVNNARGFDTHYVMNSHGAAEVVTDARGGTTRTEWDSASLQPSQVTDALGGVTTYGYDEYGNKTSESITTPHGTLSQSWTYVPPDAFASITGDELPISNRVRSHTDARDIVTLYGHDARGNRSGESRAGITTTHTYDSRGDRVSTTNGAGDTTRYRFDAHGFVTERRDDVGLIEMAEYDLLGHPIWQADGLSNVTQFEYDRRGRLVEQRLPEASGSLGVRRIEYDDAANRRTTTDELSRITIEQFDAMGRLTTVTEALGTPEQRSRSLDYDDHGNVTIETDWLGRETETVYDELDRPSVRNAPEDRSTTLTYDALGHVLTETVANREVGSSELPRISEYEYRHPLYLRTHERRQLIDDSGSRWLETIHAYDENGNPTSTTDPRGHITTQVFDDRDRLTERHQPEGRSTSIEYDDADRRIGETLYDRDGAGPDGATFIAQTREWSYDRRGRETVRTDATGAAWHSSFDAANNRTSLRDPRAGTVHYSYNARNHQIGESGPVPGRVTTYTVDVLGNRVGETHANGREIEHRIDALNRTTASLDVAGDFVRPEFQRTVFDAAGNATDVTDANGHTTVRVFDDLDRLVEERRPENRTLSWTYNIHGESITATDAEGRTSITEHDSLGRAVVQRAPAPFAYETLTTYDDSGNPLTVTDGRGHTTVHAHDGLNRRISQLDPEPLAYTQTWQYDVAGNVVEHIDRRGIVSQASFDAENRELSHSRDGQLQYTNTYDAAGNLSTVTNANGHVTTHAYDLANQRTETRRPQNSITTTTYHPWGDVDTVTDPDGVTTAHTYDFRRRLSTETRSGPNGDETTTYVHDGNGNRTARIPPKGATHTWTYEYDDANRLTRIDSPTGAITGYGYTRTDQPRTRTDARNHTTTTIYDELDRPIRIEHPDGSIEQFSEYDANGNPVERIDGNGQQIESDFDELNRRTAVRFEAISPTDIAEEIYVLDPNGNITETRQREASGTVHTHTRTWDSHERLTAETDRHSHTTQYRYDPNHNRTRRTDRAGATIYGHDSLDRLTSVQDPGGDTRALAYTAAGRLQALLHPNGAESVYRYDSAGRIDTLTHRQGGIVVGEYDYTHDTHGNRTAETHATAAGTRSSSYDFDHDDRLVEHTVTQPDGSTTHTVHTLDDVGNRIEDQITVNGQLTSSITSVFDQRNQLETQTDSVTAITTTYGYDSNGHLIEQTTAGNTTTYRPNPQDRLATLTAPTGPPVHYHYDAEGKRTDKRSTAEAIRFHWDGTQLRRETNTLGNELAAYDWAGRTLLTSTRSGTRLHAQHDALHSPVRWSEDSGSEHGSIQYDAWGQTTPSTPGLPNIAYTGHYLDPESGSYYAQQRYYRPGEGRFNRIDPWAGDPLNPVTLNKYLYANGNPLMFVDPDGRCSAMNEASTCHLRREAARVGGDQGAQLERLAAQHQQQQRDGNTYALGAIDALVVEPAVGFAQLALDTTGTHWDGKTLFFGDAQHASASMRGRGQAFADWVDNPAEATFAHFHAAEQEIGRLEAAGDKDGAIRLRGQRDAEVMGLFAGAYGGVRSLLTRPMRHVPEAPGGQLGRSADASQQRGDAAVVVEGENSPAGVVELADAALYARSTFRRPTLRRAEIEAPRNEIGEMLCPTCSEIIPERLTIQTVRGPIQRRGYDLDHYPKTWAKRIAEMKAAQVRPTRKEVLDEYNRDVRVLCPECNQGHKFEGNPEL